jgi:hypothetical protein
VLPPVSSAATTEPPPSATTYGGVAHLFLRLLGVVYLMAFASLWLQIHGLVGSQGILPLEERDLALHLVCAAGVLLASLLLFDIVPALVLAALFGLYLWLVDAGQFFLLFQWDSLLLETGFLAIFLAPLGWRGRASDEPRLIAVWLLRWLLFRLLFSSGVVKLASGDPTWRSLTALRYHYETQPLPTWVGFWVHQLPGWFQTASCLLMFAVELAVPCLIFAPRRLRVASFVPLVGLQLLIAATGNYGFFNLLTVALCFLLLDDIALPARWRRPSARPESSPRRAWPLWVVIPVAVPILVLSVVLLTSRLGLVRHWPRPVIALYRALAPFGIVNSYGLFAVMTTERPEIVLEGSDDGSTWRAYEFRWKPGDPRRAPAFVAPRQPRLDWQMWFAALGSCEENPWVLQLLTRIQAGSPAVLGLLASNPFPDRPPRHVRAVLYDYRFTDVATHRKDGTWWRRERKALYCPELPLALESP